MANKSRKKEEEIKIIHHFVDGTESETLEGHVIPDDIQIKIFEILLAGQERRRQQNMMKN